MPGSIVVGMDIFVDLEFFLVCFKCPCAVATDFGNYLCSSLDVNPVHDCKNPLPMASIHVDGTGMNASSYRWYCIISGSYDVCYKLLL